VWRAVRVAPVDAIRTGHLAARGGGLAPLLKRIPMPGDSFGQMPFRNLLRAPRRGVLTLLGIAAIITVLVGVVGMVDSFLATIERGEEELLGDTPDRLLIDLDSLHPVDSQQVAGVLQAKTVTSFEPGLRLIGTLSNDGEEIDAFLQLIDFGSALWTPTALRGSLKSERPGVVIAEKAAKDLGVDVGDTVILRHPLRKGLLDFTFERTELPVLAIHPDPIRLNVYMDIAHAGLMGLGGTTNIIQARPAPGQAVDAVNRELFELPGVASVQGVATSAEIFRELMEEFVGILRVLEGAVLGLALLIAFNTASINADERAREHATMFAYGVRVRTVMRIAVIESAVIGALATSVGLGGGYLMLKWMIEVLWPRVSPDLGALLVIEPTTLVAAVGLGVLAVAIAPLLTIRRLRRMDVPSTLRVME
jgi:putative ABC transport system permease protein